MLSRSHLDALLDIRDNARLAEQWTNGHTHETFRAERRTCYAVVRCLEIISEASRRLPQPLLDRHPELPWRLIRDAGNVYRHRYNIVAEDLVLDTVRQDIGPLLAVVEREIADISAFAGRDSVVPGRPLDGEDEL
jgi:uncharacterized protein with HEPN domain